MLRNRGGWARLSSSLFGATAHWTPSLSVQVKAYDAGELSLLQKLPCWPEIEAIVGPTSAGQANNIPTEQFLLYSMFRDLDCNSISDLKGYIRHQERRLSRLVVGTSGAVTSRPGLEATEHTAEAADFGIAFGLTVADLIFGTTEMDWKSIPVKRTRDNDYLGSNGSIHIDLEVKGSFVEDISKTPSTISNHKASIKAKKVAKGTPPANTVHLGLISAIAGTGIPVVRVVDPPSEVRQRSPQDQQLLHRMDFLSRWISCLSPRSALAVALRGRLEALLRLDRLEQLDGLALVSGTGEKIDVSPYQFGQVHSRFFATKSVVSDGPTGGMICRHFDRVFFFGIMDDLLTLSVNQDFKDIRSFRRNPGTVTKAVSCIVPKGRKSEFDQLPIKWDSNDGFYFRFEAKGDLHYTAGGLVFGLLSV